MDWERRAKLVVTVVVLLTILFLFYSRGWTIFNKRDLINLDKSGKLLRLHVVGNSNSLRDQHIKRQIKEEVLTDSGALLRKRRTAAPIEVVRDNKERLTEMIKTELAERGVDYGVELELDKSVFPTRSYGDRVLPAGNYQSLQVVLGAGQGQNWWCVLFPPLCFVDSIDELSERELDRLTRDNQSQKLPVEFKLKGKEIIEANPQLVKSKLRWIQLLETSFPGVENLITPGYGEKQTD